VPSNQPSSSPSDSPSVSGQCSRCIMCKVNVDLLDLYSHIDSISVIIKPSHLPNPVAAPQFLAYQVSVHTQPQLLSSHLVSVIIAYVVFTYT
jgi:hypothetical protein